MATISAETLRKAVNTAELVRRIFVSQDSARPIVSTAELDDACHAAVYIAAVLRDMNVEVTA